MAARATELFFARQDALPDALVLSEAIDLLRQALRACPSTEARRFEYESLLAMALQARFDQTMCRRDLEGAIKWGRRAAARSSADIPELGACLAILTNALLIRYENTHRASDIDEAIAVSRRAVGLHGRDDLERAVSYSDLSAALLNRYEDTGTSCDLAEAIDMAARAVEVAPSGDPTCDLYLSNLNVALWTHYNRTQREGDLDDAIAAGRACVDATPAGSTELAGRLSDLGVALRTRFALKARLADIEEAIDVGRRAVAMPPTDNASRAGYLSNLSLALQEYGLHARARADLDEAVTVSRSALALVGSHSSRVRILYNLSVCLQARFRVTGETDDLDDAVSASRDALSACHQDRSAVAASLASLSAALRTRYEARHGLEDLDEAVEVGQLAVMESLPDDPCAGERLATQSGTLARRFERTRASRDLQEAVELARRALDVTPADHPNHAGYLSTLGGTLLYRFECEHEPADLSDAVHACEEAVASTSEDAPDFAVHLSNLSAAVQVRFDTHRAPADICKAVELARRALNATTSDEAARAVYWANLGVALRRRCEEAPAPADLAEAVDAFRRAAQWEGAPPDLRAESAREWGRLAASREDWPEAAKAYTVAIGFLAQVAPRSLAREDQEHELARLAGIAADATACCLQANDPGAAIGLWEQGRGVLLGQALDARTDTTVLAEQDPELARRFLALRDELEGLPDRDGVAPLGRWGVRSWWIQSGAGTHSAFQRQVDSRRRLAAEFSKLVDEIRENGFDRFLLPPTLDELVSAAKLGPIALINVSDLRSDALLLTAGGQLRVVPLPRLTNQVVREQVGKFLSALDLIDAGATQLCDAERCLVEVLGWLWDLVAAPVLERLGIAGRSDPGPSSSRMWWCSSGLMSLLPLHAAGHHEYRRGTVSQAVIDRVISSYTPTVRALLRARQGSGVMDGIARSEHVAIVAMPRTPGSSALRGARAEAKMIRGLFGERAAILQGRGATHKAVADALPLYPWAHFACHGSSDVQDPSRSHLLLSDYRKRPLTVMEVSRLRLERAEFAFLSACSTAKTGVTLPDEAIHLASAFQVAGYRSVIATLWEIDDRVATQIAERVYRKLAITEDADDAAAALHDAVCAAREIHRAQPSRWAAHIHHGV